MQALSLQKQIPVISTHDVVVCGGGCAGFIAAISAARSGRSVALIERLGFFGGTATGGYVVPISGFFFEGQQVVGGIAWEFVQRLEAIGAAMVEHPRGHVSVNIEYYKLIAQEMLLESGVTLYTNSYLSNIFTEKTENGTAVTHVVIESKNGTEAIAGRCFIDATGDGDLAHLAGVPMLPPAEHLQPASLCFVLTNVNTDTDLLRYSIHHDGKHGASCNATIRNRLLAVAEKNGISEFGGPWFNTLLKGNSLAVNITRTEVNATDRAAYTEAEGKLRRDMFRIVDLLRQEFEEFRDCEIVASGVNAGIRETRHIRGLHTMSLSDLLNGTVFPCPVAHCAHPIDIHAAKGAGQQVTALKAACYVPYEATVAEGFPNLLTAGRSVSAEREPYASLRVQATLMSIGECAGVAASLACETDAPVYALPIDTLAEKIAARKVVL